MEAIATPVVVDNGAALHDSEGDNHVALNEAERFNSPGSDGKVLDESHSL